jgi:hypothetical protein
MLLTFKSPTGADLVMFDKSAKEILALLGKNPEDGRGIILVEQLPAAIATLRAALADDQANPPAPGDQANERDAEPQVSLSQRAIPFIEMLERALKDKEAITWGV